MMTASSKSLQNFLSYPADRGIIVTVIIWEKINVIKIVAKFSLQSSWSKFSLLSSWSGRLWRGRSRVMPGWALTLSTSSNLYSILWLCLLAPSTYTLSSSWLWLCLLAFTMWLCTLYTVNYSLYFFLQVYKHQALILSSRWLYLATPVTNS